mmetsp:Transcript_45822/g.97762  ORF Transcript_45822/g.97762 Transcript_45822/m.97762 type:complete len:180 (-) Transcript_45822:172-711(-)|eukprot:CAMPEP_0183335592 /NCGR_PEP_ID=MMETSP0164_2-20130417/3849_1 /TAXON_ID=221442 /ORGANISM="Coccolithus pelagicus ssp braarudi, Strain PLY182g" /LENGTH=179 /DNA_ID=CAMNT_0025504983 /DNA_START=65 /DNA_END=604 /DNA_ORIENTATION=+
MLLPSARIGATESISRVLCRRGELLSVAETSAGGLISASLHGIRDAHVFFRGGVVCGCAESRAALLGIHARSKLTSTEAHALELARAVRMKTGSDWAVAESGVAGPSPGERGVQAGVCALAVVGPAGFKRYAMLWPDTELSAADAYGQPPKIERQERMAHFRDGALSLLLEALEAHSLQ